MAVLELAAVAALASACIPTLSHVRERLIAHAMVESGFDPLVINDNTTKAAYRFTDEASAWSKASTLVAAGHSVDGGISQVNSQHWNKLLNGPRLFNAKANLCAGAVILIQDYEAACLYNSGKPYCDPAKYPAAIAHAQSVIAAQSADQTPPTKETPSQQHKSPCDAVPSYDLEARTKCHNEVVTEDGDQTE